MKNLFTILLALWAFSGKAQLVLNKALTPQNGRYYFELTNNTTAPLDLGCYTLLSSYSTTTSKGFYVLTLPYQSLTSNGLLTIGSSLPAYGNANSNRIELDLKDLYAKGLLQRQVINENNDRFANTTSLLANPNEILNQLISTDFDDHLVLVFNGTTLIDASFSVDPAHNLSEFLKLLPNLSFTNSCGNLVTIRFGSLQSMYPSIFNRPNEQYEYGYFEEFEVQKNNASVQVAWQTTRELHNQGFEIERRTGAEPWTTVAYIATLAPAGNSSETLKYMYGDNTLLRGNLEYRLKQIDVNGRAAYSPVKTINSFGQVDKLTVYPNPSTDGRVTVAFGNVNTLRDVQVTDLNGQLIQQWISVNNSNQQINNLQRGSYFIRVIDRQTGVVSTEKVIVR